MELKNKNKYFKSAVIFILLFGVISALGDTTYEGGRSIYGNYLLYLGADTFIIGIITGLGEFLGYGLRLLSGYIVDKTQNSWIVTIIGYVMVASVPLLAFTNSWETAGIFINLERIGKAIRSPGKDTLISHASKHLGSGFSFGISEAMDQVGAVVGPLIFTIVLMTIGSYKTGFNILWIPTILLIILVFYTRSRFPKPEQMETKKFESTTYITSVKNSKFIYYMLFIFFSVFGFITFPILSYYFLASNIMSASFVPTLYAIAMEIDGIFAIIIGKIYDKKGNIILYLIPLLTILMILIVFKANFLLAIISMIIWGCIMSIHETILKANIADMVSKSSRGKAYGIFNTIYGFAFLT
ncbi:MAG: MFS transporter [Methanobacteriaceae archaeon]|nr:MFS transporter [Methanobacteriaceae archaeon]